MICDMMRNQKGEEEDAENAEQGTSCLQRSMGMGTRSTGTGRDVDGLNVSISVSPSCRSWLVGSRSADVISGAEPSSASLGVTHTPILPVTVPLLEWWDFTAQSPRPPVISPRVVSPNPKPLCLKYAERRFKRSLLPPMVMVE